MDFSSLSPHMRLIDVSWHSEFDNHEAVIEITDPCGLHVILAIHRFFFHPYLDQPSTLGGTRLGAFTREEAITQALRLSKAMTSKAALAGTDFGGAKAVMIAAPRDMNVPIDAEFARLLAVYAEYLNLLQGAYVTAEDMDFFEKYLTYMRRYTRWVAGAGKEAGESGNPSPYTARGVYLAIKQYLSLSSWENRGSRPRFAISGVGSVGLPLAELLAYDGEVYIADVSAKQLARALSFLGGRATVVQPNEIHAKEATVYVPCAGGAVLNSRTIYELGARAVIGAANNQLATREDGWRLHKRDIFYGVDYVVNSGGLLSVALEFTPGGHSERAFAENSAIIQKNLLRIWWESRRDDIPMSIVADNMAQKIIAGKTSAKELWQKHG